MKKRFLSILLTLAMAFALCVPAFAVDLPDGAEDLTDGAEKKLPFTDVEEDYWAYDDILYCYEQKLIKGKTETRFDPTGKLTVAEAVALAGRLCSLTHGGDGTLPELPDLTKPYARFYDKDGELIAELDQEHGPVSFNEHYIALSAKEDDPALPETCTMEVGIEGLLPAKTFEGVRKTFPPSDGHMSQGLDGTGYLFEDGEAGSIFNRFYFLVNPDGTASACVNEWWYSAAFYLQFYCGYNAITDMCFHYAVAHPDAEGWISTDYDALGMFPKEHITRTMFANLIGGAVSDELEAINDISAIPDVDAEKTTGAEAILRLYGAGILVGVDNTGRFHGAGELTRAQTATILTRVLEPESRVTVEA